jgi:hypothetical protein
MIPWIIALALLFGISVITPDRPSEGELGASKEASISQAADHAQLSGHSSVPLLKLPSIVWSYSGLAAPTSLLLHVDHPNDRRVRKSSRGVSQGRAPPACLLA